MTTYDVYRSTRVVPNYYGVAPTWEVFVRGLTREQAADAARVAVLDPTTLALEIRRTPEPPAEMPSWVPTDPGQEPAP